MNTLSRTTIALGALALLSFSNVAHAQYQWDWSYSLHQPDSGLMGQPGYDPGGTVSASGTLITNNTLSPGKNGDMGYLITSIAGTRTDDLGQTSLITGLLPVNDPLFLNDNVIFAPGTPSVDLWGFAYSITGAGNQGTNKVDFAWEGGYTEATIPFHADSGSITLTPVNFSLASSTPEPGSVALLIGMASAGLGLRRKRRN